jgi:photosystem II stability/assembly factor-like uncharacterized protein
MGFNIEAGARKSRNVLYEEDVISELFTLPQWLIDMSRFGVIMVVLVIGNASVAFSQWTKVYQTDSCDCSLGIHEPLAGMRFFGNDSGVVCSEGNGAMSAVTFDGCLSWDSIPINPTVRQNIYPPPYGQGSNSYFLDVSHIWFCNGAALCHTNNAGKTWVVDSNRDSLGYSAVGIYFIDSLVGFEGGAALTMFRTSDGGKSWSMVHNQSDGNGYNVYQIKFCTPKLGLAICGDLVGLILRTSDSGITWVLTTDVNHFGYGQAQSLSYPDPHNAWFTDGIALRHSSDSGLTWNIVGGQAPLGGLFRSISFVDSLHGIAIASAGLSHTDPLIIGYTSDGGNSWQTNSIDSEATEGGFASFPNLNTAYVGGFDAVYKLNVGDLAVLEAPHDSTGASIESVGGNLFLVMPQNAGGRLRIIDALGRVMKDEMLSPGARSEIGNGAQPMPQFRFAEVECDGRVQVFKILQ